MSKPRYTRNLGNQSFPTLIGDGNFTWSTQFGQVENVLGEVGLWQDASIKTFPTVASLITVVSDNAADNIAGPGTGAHLCVMYGLDANFAQIFEPIPVFGLTPSVSTLEFIRINRVIVLQSGTGRINAGTLTFEGGGHRYSQISPNEGIGKTTYHTVPLGKTGYCGDVQLFAAKSGGGGNPVVTFKLWVRFNNYQPPGPAAPGNSDFKVWEIVLDTAVSDYIKVDSVLGDFIPEKSDVWITVSSDINCDIVTAHHQLYREDRENAFRPFDP